MKKVFLLIVLLIAGITNAQEFTNDTKSITGVFEVKEKTKSEIFSSINKWITLNYNSSKTVLQMNDLESGTIIIKGINEVTYKNSAKELYPKDKYVGENTTTKFNHLIEINIKDNKFRVIYKLIDMVGQDVGFNGLLFNIVNLNNGNIDSQVNQYNDEMDKILKVAYVGKEKRELLKEKNKLMFADMNVNLINNLKNTMINLEKSIATSAKDEW